MKNISLFALLYIGLCLPSLSTYAQNNAQSSQGYQLPNYNLGAMLVGVRVPNNWNASPIIIGKVTEQGNLTLEWPALVPAELKDASEALNLVLRTGNCDPAEDSSGILVNKEAGYVLFSRIWLMDPETKEVQGQLMATNSDSLMAWMHKPDETLAATGTYTYLLYAYEENTLRSTCKYETWVTPEGKDEITLNHTFDNDLNVTRGFQFVIYETKEVYPYAGMQPKWQQVSAAASIPDTIHWKFKE